MNTAKYCDHLKNHLIQRENKVNFIKGWVTDLYAKNELVTGVEVTNLDG